MYRKLQKEGASYVFILRVPKYFVILILISTVIIQKNHLPRIKEEATEQHEGYNDGRAHRCRHADTVART